MPRVATLASGDAPALPAGMLAAYGEVHFVTPDNACSLPRSFAIITAYATTGERWSKKQNEAADTAFETELRQRGLTIHRITGYSPATGHAEPGWVVPLSFDAACDLGRRYKQDALYYVKDDALSVSYCDARRSRIALGSFWPRLHRDQMGSDSI